MMNSSMGIDPEEDAMLYDLSGPTPASNNGMQNNNNSVSYQVYQTVSTNQTQSAGLYSQPWEQPFERHQPNTYSIQQSYDYIDFMRSQFAAQQSSDSGQSKQGIKRKMEETTATNQVPAKKNNSN